MFYERVHLSSFYITLALMGLLCVYGVSSRDFKEAYIIQVLSGIVSGSFDLILMCTAHIDIHWTVKETIACHLYSSGITALPAMHTSWLSSLSMFRTQTIKLSLLQYFH